MSSGFTSGGPDFYAAALTGRSMNVVVNNANGGGVSQPGYHHHHLHNQIPSRMQPGIFMDTSSSSQVSQITNRVGSNLIGKRSFTDFHAPPPQQQLQIQPQFQPQFQQQHQNQTLNNLYLRSVKSRVAQNLGPYEDLYQPSPSRYRLPNPLLQLQQQQIRPQVEINQNQSQIQNQNQRVGFSSGNFNPYLNNNNKPVVQVQQDVVVQEKEEKKMQMLKELEKQLLDDNDEEDVGDAVSVITNMTSEWSETIQNLMSPTINKPVSPISPSPTTSSSSSSSSVASPATICTKQTVIEAATAISESRTDVAAEILNRLSQVSSKGNSEQRLMEYMTSALKSRMNMVENPAPSSELFTPQHTESTQCLYDLSPCFKLGFMAANLAILEAVNECSDFHVVDFDIGQGGQYMNLLHALVKQNGKQSVVTITAVADNVIGEETLTTVGDMLKQVAERVGVRLNFKTIRLSKLSDLSRESLGCDPNEALAVNFAFKLFKMADESVSTENPRDDLLRRVKALSPRVVTLVEQELNTNTAPFLHRVNETMSYYGALLDSIESASRDHQDLVKVEEGLGRKLSNSVACEGRDRVERCEVFGKWRARMSMAGFQLKPMSQTIAESMRARLSSCTWANPGYTVKEENGGVCFGWMGRILTVTSAWR